MNVTCAIDLMVAYTHFCCFQFTNSQKELKMKITKIIGLLFLVGMVIGIGRKLIASLDYTGDSAGAVFAFVVAGLLMFLALRKIIRD